jgi:hypothetical protein
MQTSSSLERVTKDIEKIEKKIENAEIERKNAKEKLEAAVVEEKAAEIRQDLRALLDSATQELTRLGQEKVKLIEERRDLEKMQNSQQHQSVASLWRVTGSISGGRKVGFRRGLYRISQDNLGFYEKKQGVKENPFSYRENDILAINVLFENRSEALHFLATVYENVSIVSPNEEVKADVSVEFALGAELDETILVGHYSPDKDSPPETPRNSVATELYDISPLFQYQRLEAERYFGAMYKADRAHLIDKPLCEKGKRFAKYQDNENNYLALSKEVHCWFDALSNIYGKIPFFNLRISSVAEASDPAYAHRYRVDLIVEAFDVEAARLLFPRLKEGSRILTDTTMGTFVYVLNPEDFRICLTWKAAKIDRLWNFDPAVE